jgi:4-amino-4-deoxy-L-arabinose transferase-like glycosyltransferase
LLFLVPRVAVPFVGPLHQTSDFRWYYESAAGLAAGNVYRDHDSLTAFWPVGWPEALVGLFEVTGPSALACQIANLVMAGGVCVLTAWLGGTLFGNRRVGRLAALMLAIYPNQIAYVPLLSVEIFYEVVLLGCLCLLLSERFQAALLAGVLFGIATLTKAQSLTLPLFLFPWVFLLAPRRPPLRRFLMLGGGVYVALILTVAPWTCRNWTVFHLRSVYLFYINFNGFIGSTALLL